MMVVSSGEYLGLQTACDVVPAGVGLVLASVSRPVQFMADGLFGLPECVEQATGLVEGQGDHSSGSAGARAAG